jgi:hypothetical protein
MVTKVRLARAEIVAKPVDDRYASAMECAAR